MYWADKVANEIIKSKYFKPYWVDDMFTPSGYAHIGSLRGPLVHDLIFKALKYAGENSNFTFVINDFDPIDGLPENLQKDFSKYLGIPLRQVPSPEKGYASFAEFFAADCKNVLQSLGVNPNFLSSYDMYREGKFDQAIKITLDNAEKIQDIYQKVSGSKKKDAGWLPLQVICQNCGKLGTTRVHNWDGQTVTYTCEPNMVKWVTGCGFVGKISPFGGNGKLPWKVDWPAHWMVIGVTIEGEGKDHSSAGGSRDIAKALCKEVFKIKEPFDLPYEFFLIGGKKMASSKGLGLKAKDLVKLFPLEVGRFLFCRTDYRQTVEFNPIGTMAIPDLFDEYDRCYQAFIDGSNEDLARVFAMSQIEKVPAKEKTFLPRFIDMVKLIQIPNVNLTDWFTKVKGSSLSEIELGILEERKKYGQIWLDKYAPEEHRLTMTENIPAQVKELDAEQKEYLKQAISLIDQSLDGEALQVALYNLAKEQKIEAKKAFGAIYKVMIGKDFGPKAGSYLRQYPKEKVILRFKESIND